MIVKLSLRGAVLLGVLFIFGYGANGIAKEADSLSRGMANPLCPRNF